MKLLPQLTDTAKEECKTSCEKFLYHTNNIAKANSALYESFPVIVGNCITGEKKVYNKNNGAFYDLKLVQQNNLKK